MLKVFSLCLKAYAYFEKVKIVFNDVNEARKYTRYCITKGCSILLVLHQMWWVYNLKNYFKLQLLEFLLLGGQSIIGLGCLLFFSFV
ncbi:hypothetical protein ACMUHV_13075, partial [Staphylococcus aureus]